MNEKAEKAAEKPSFAESLLEYAESFVFTAVIFILLITFCIRPCVVDGPSMNLTLSDGETLLVSNFFYTPRSGDIIVFHQTSEIDDRFNEAIVKRVIATGGQYVKIDYAAGKIYVSDDESFTENDLLDERAYAYFSGGTWREAAYYAEPLVTFVPQGYLFVLGDNRNNSADSRDARVGLVDERRVLGKVVLRLAPFSAFGPVK